MNRTGLLIALIAAVVTGVLFAAWPHLDIVLAAPFFDAARGYFVWDADPLAETLRDLVSWVVQLIAFAAFGALVVKLAVPRWRMLLPGRTVLLLLSTLLVGPGLLTNVVLKDHWHRPRPVHLTQFNGDREFVAWWDNSGTCPRNCSFVSGEVASATWTLAAAALVPPPWRAIAYAAALTLTAGITLLRLAAGGHFVTDAIFAMVLTFLVVWIAHGLIYRWPATRITDDTVEAELELASRRIGVAAGWVSVRAANALRALERYLRPAWAVVGRSSAAIARALPPITLRLDPDLRHGLNWIANRGAPRRGAVVRIGRGAGQEPA